MRETWRPVKDHPAYEVSDRGKVRRVKRSRGARPGRVLKFRLNSDGYRYVVLSDAPLRVRRFIHHLVADAFLTTRRTKNSEVNHKDLRKPNNAPLNLERVTHQRNMQHAADAGKQSRKGSVNGRAVISARQARRLKALIDSGMRTCDILRRVRFHVTRSIINGIRFDGHWAHLFQG